MKTDDFNNNTRVRVRYADTDQLGIAYNGIYFTWFEIGRTELFRDTGLNYNDVEKFGIHLPLIEAGIKYLKPARYDDVLSIVTTLDKKQGVRVRFIYEIWKNEEKMATGYTEHVFTDDKLRPIKPPEELKNLLNKGMVTTTSSSEKRIIL